MQIIIRIPNKFHPILNPYRTILISIELFKDYMRTWLRHFKFLVINNLII